MKHIVRENHSVPNVYDNLEMPRLYKGLKICMFAVVLTVSLLSQWIPTVESVVSGQYDQYCKDDNDCSSMQGLTCQNQRCKCAAGGETVFSISKNRCVGAAGRECLRSENGTEIGRCVENSVCRDYNYMFLCVCSEGHYQSMDGNCYKIAQFGESCREEDYACGDSVTTSISCVERKCSCLLGENQYYDPLEARCISYAGSQCLFHYPKPCSDNSYCGEIAENINGASFVVGHRCLCKVGYSYTRNRRCLARYGTQCSATNPCNYDDNLGCLNGICQCRNPLTQVFDEESGQCRILVGSRCNPESAVKCVEHGECRVSRSARSAKTNSTSSTRPPSYRCACSNGFSQTPLGTCLVDYEQKCEPGSCNHYNALACVNGTCACVDSSLGYDPSSKVCVAMMGQPCGHVKVYDNSIPGSNEPIEIVVFCEGNAVCVKSPVYSGMSFNGAQMKRICKSSSSTSSAKN